jgi:hypothetical protein
MSILQVGTQTVAQIKTQRSERPRGTAVYRPERQGMGVLALPDQLSVITSRLSLQSRELRS